MCNKIPAKRLCEICGAVIPYKPGMPAKTCGAEHAAERKRRRENERYQKVKGTEQWKATRSSYLDALKQRLDEDQEFAAIFRAHSRAAVRKNTVKRNADPAIRLADLKRKRAERQAWREQLVDSPEAWEAHKAAARAWYASLSDADKMRIFYEPAKQRAAMKNV